MVSGKHSSKVDRIWNYISEAKKKKNPKHEKLAISFALILVHFNKCLLST